MTLIIALDPGPELRGEAAARWMSRICMMTEGYASGYKIGLPALLKTGPQGIASVLDSCRADLLIADMKLADIGYIMSLAADELINMGFNAVIAHAFMGYSDALSVLSEELRRRGGRLITVVAMSHRGSEEVMDKAFTELLRIAVAAGSWGLVLPATRPHLVRAGRETGTRILSPGVGAQGARPGDALCAGADYEIVGRAITMDPEPGEAARRIVEAQREAVARCRT